MSYFDKRSFSVAKKMNPWAELQPKDSHKGLKTQATN
mgnify:CR=1 FL=1